ncbi:MAG TPA: type II toxin-antitoxin system RelE/ParE family toxin [Archangium sp.]|uniref:type II toxin-antitoxin system RelE/ParE family toxin n=1 Tax=Archangium sp. TaxID=1872627 RepID=UPI002E310DF0|nr:type II toxin-antitoxin system RelE/ParE family toxin [Archangium sp.]HEX5750633.1 type II toxin-antitoxin system RelE/ParE family toxin [Archangium sp.]
MARVVYAARALADFERIVDFVAGHSPELAELAVARISEAVSVLEKHPLIGRPAEQGLRELVISRGRTGYIALYRFLKAEDTVLVLALRHQREVGYVDVDE